MHTFNMKRRKTDLGGLDIIEGVEEYKGANALFYGSTLSSVKKLCEK